LPGEGILILSSRVTLSRSLVLLPHEAINQPSISLRSVRHIYHAIPTKKTRAIFSLLSAKRFQFHEDLAVGATREKISAIAVSADRYMESEKNCYGLFYAFFCYHQLVVKLCN
jgi:hypothetical protein